jgi:isopenicillin N synthase-like dioxygenase
MSELDRAPIPLVDFAQWKSANPLERLEAVKATESALRDSGFLLLINHGIDAKLFSDARKVALEFFRLEEQAKQRHAITPGAYRGWASRGSEKNGATGLGAANKPDLKESFTIGPWGRPDDAYHQASPSTFAPNKLPGDLPEFEETWKTLYSSLESLAAELLKLVETSLDLPAGTFLDKCRRHSSLLTANWYPAMHGEIIPENQFRVGPHTDYGIITLLDRQFGSGGLQVQLPDGTWVDAPWVENALTINVADLLSRWTGLHYRSAIHRVLAPPPEAPNEELVSLVFFQGADYDTLITPVLPTDHDVEPVVAGDYLRMKLATLQGK